VEGEGGIGKTRLLQEFAERCADGADVLWATAVAERALPLEPVLQAVAEAIDALADDESRAVLGEHADLLEPLLRPGATGPHNEYRDVVAALEPTTAATPALHLALLAVVARLARRRPLVLVIDDAHLCDAPS